MKTITLSLFLSFSSIAAHSQTMPLRFNSPSNGAVSSDRTSIPCPTYGLKQLNRVIESQESENKISCLYKITEPEWDSFSARIHCVMNGSQVAIPDVEVLVYCTVGSVSIQDKKWIR